MSVNIRAASTATGPQRSFAIVHAVEEAHARLDRGVSGASGSRRRQKSSSRRSCSPGCMRTKLSSSSAREQEVDQVLQSRADCAATTPAPRDAEATDGDSGFASPSCHACHLAVVASRAGSVRDVELGLDDQRSPATRPCPRARPARVCARVEHRAPSSATRVQPERTRERDAHLRRRTVRRAAPGRADRCGRCDRRPSARPGS